MEEQVPASQIPEQPIADQPLQNASLPGYIGPEQLAQMKARARELAFQQTIAQQAVPQFQRPQPQVVYVRRNLTVAELIVTLVLACGIVTGFQAGWHFAANYLPRLEVKVK